MRSWSTCLQLLTFASLVQVGCGTVSSPDDSSDDASKLGGAAGANYLGTGGEGGVKTGGTSSGGAGGESWNPGGDAGGPGGFAGSGGAVGRSRFASTCYHDDYENPQDLKVELRAFSEWVDCRELGSDPLVLSGVEEVRVDMEATADGDVAGFYDATFTDESPEIVALRNPKESMRVRGAYLMHGSKGQVLLEEEPTDFTFTTDWEAYGGEEGALELAVLSATFPTLGIETISFFE